MAKRTTKPTDQKQSADVVEAVMPLKRAEDGTLGTTTSEIPEGIPSATAISPQHAQPEPESVEEGAASSSTEASTASAQAAETGEAVGQVMTGDLPTTDSDGQAVAAEASNDPGTAEENKTSTGPSAGSFEGKVAEAFAAQARLDETTVEAIKTQILGLPSVERRHFLALKTIRHDNRHVPAGGWLTVTRSAHAKLAARKLVSEDWDAGLLSED